MATRAHAVKSGLSEMPLTGLPTPQYRMSHRDLGLISTSEILLAADVFLVPCWVRSAMVPLVQQPAIAPAQQVLLGNRTAAVRVSPTVVPIAA